MKILMFGRGVISTQYAWALEKEGHTVEFYVRRGRKAELGQSVSLNIYDARKKISGVLIKKNWNISLTENLNSNHDYDLIIVSVQHYHLNDVIGLLADRIGDATILLFNNFWNEPQEIVSKLPEKQVVWGFPGAAGGFDDKGILNGSLFGSVTIGTFNKDQTHRGRDVINLFKAAGFKVKESRNFRAWLLSHFVLNAAMHLENLKYKDGMKSLENLQTTKHWNNVVANGKELLPLLAARNVDLKASSDLKIFTLPPWFLSFVMKIVIKFLPSVRQIFTGHSNRFELQSYCQDVMTTGDQMEINLPRFKASENIYKK